MAKFSCQNVGDATGYILWDPPDELLRSISKEYIGACFQKLSEHVLSFGGRPQDLRFGWLHDGVASVPSGRESPLSYVGWVWADYRPALGEDEEAKLAEVLLEKAPRLLWAGSYRAGAIDCNPADPAEVLVAIREYVLDDPSAGHPDWLARGAGGAQMLDDIVSACRGGNREEVLRTLDRALTRYSSHGGSVLRDAVLQWLDGPDGLST